ncbi:MAG: hypothetical protein IJ849_05020 [Selenomonadaceae bacterium]|nr:hypothetical protein [Selenomonadaceae bacterium]
MSDSIITSEADIDELLYRDDTEFVSMSSEGLVNIPSSIRASLGLVPNSTMLIVRDGSGIRIQPLPKPDIEKFCAGMQSAAAWAKEVGLTEQDIADAIREVREENRVRKYA